MTLFTDVLPVDHDVRERVRTDLGRNLFVEAGAGTGKTRVLVDRVVRLVATGTVSDISRLVAITFTEAAAAELRDRIRTELERGAADHSLPDDERLRCSIARTNIDRATITTLHGFAQRILAEHPLDVGLAPVFDIDDEVQARVRFVERWMHFRDDLFDDKTAAEDLLFLHALGFSTDRLRDVARMLHQRWDALVGVEFPVPHWPVIDVASITEPIRQAFAVAEPHWPREGDRLIELVDEWAALLAALDDAAAVGDELEVIRVLLPKIWAPSNQGKAELWGAEKKTILSLLTAADAARIGLLEQLRTAVLQRFMPRLQAFTLAGVEERRQSGRLEFHDLLVHARDVLRTNQEVRVAMAGRIDVILIDEFQDTDPLQLDIAFSLAADDPVPTPPPWPEAVLRPGKILVVGDPKQSIYRFRGADISLWDRTKRLFPDGIEQLGQNFRTVPPLLEWVNRVFRSVIAEGEEGAQPAYHDLSPFRPEAREGPAVVVVGARHAAITAAELRELEASDLARLIVEMKVNRWEVEDVGGGGGCRPTRFDDIAILVPTRTPLAQLERALDAKDVPYRVESRSLVWATDAVRELLAVLGAIDDPADDIAVVAALRSPGFACSDVDLVEWKVAGGGWDYQRSLCPDSIADDHPVAAGMAALARYHGMRWNLPVDNLVELVIRERQLIELTFALRRPRDHWRRLRFVLDQARAFVEAGGASLGDFAAWAQLQSDGGAMVVETPAPEPDDDAVRILTIHGSKGLEFPIVVLAGLSSAGRDSGPWVLYGDDGPEVAVGPRDARFTTPGYAALAARAGDADAHEGHRLLYVAATRARDHLVVGLGHSERGQSTPARELWNVCQDSAAGWWNPVEFGDQLTLPVEIRSTDFQPATVDDRTAWRTAHDDLLANANERRVFAATAIAALHELDEPIDSVAADDAPTSLPPAIRRGGTALGRAVHAVLATVDLDEPDDLSGLAASQAAAEGIGDVADVGRRARSALDAPVVLAARAAARRWRELYVAAPVGDRGRLIEGYIDLLFEDERGELVVVDYKTDADLDTAADRYRLQAATYALALESTLGRPVSRAVFVFCRPEGAVEREIADLAEAIDEVRALVG
jgi:ATP-dependent helicase/nuclease subunit A